MEEITYTNHKEVSCSGGQSGHPKIYLHLNSNEEITCPYCSHKFILQQQASVK